jgi:excisionase family DNA binding protein
MENNELVYTPREVAGILHMSMPTLYQQISAGTIPSLRFGRQLRIPKMAFQKMLEQCQPTAVLK